MELNQFLQGIEKRKAHRMAEETNNTEAEKSAGIMGTLSKLGAGAWICIALVTLVIGVLIGRFALGGGAGASLNKSSLTEGELDTVVATYNQNGAGKSVTARQVIEMTSSLESAKDEEGNYKVPSADNILYAVRNTIAIAEAESRGINPTDDQLLDYAEKTLGQTPDFESIASANNIDVDTVKKLLTDSYRIHELQAQIGGENAATEPEYPTEPEYATTNEAGESLSSDEIKQNQEAAYNEVKKEYAEYIIKLAGEEWDAENNKWKSEDGPYATALASYQITNDGATFQAAYAAYQVAYSNYSTAQSEYYQKITDYLAGLYSKCSIDINTLIQ